MMWLLGLRPSHAHHGPLAGCTSARRGGDSAAVLLPVERLDPRTSIWCGPLSSLLAVLPQHPHTDATSPHCRPCPRATGIPPMVTSAQAKALNLAAGRTGLSAHLKLARPCILRYAAPWITSPPTPHAHTPSTDLDATSGPVQMELGWATFAGNRSHARQVSSSTPKTGARTCDIHIHTRIEHLALLTNTHHHVRGTP